MTDSSASSRASVYARITDQIIAAMERACVEGVADVDAVVRGGIDGFAFAQRALADRCGTETPVD